MRQKSFFLTKTVLIALVILSGAIALPVLFRLFFYLHIEPMELAQSVDLTVQQIKTAYNEMMDYCMGLSDSFSVGVLPFSESGAAHFADVRKLFLLDLWVFAISSVVLTVLCLTKRGKCQIAGHTTGFWAAIGLGVAFLAVGGLAALDFEKAFTVFHKLFFPGKDNWLFDSRLDPVIQILPAEFFRNCAILILAAILISCAALLLWDRRIRKKSSRLP